MEAILRCFFDNFEQSERNSLHARYRRRGMVDYFNTMIEGCRLGQNCDAKIVVRETIREILRFHDDSRKKNVGVCTMGKYHDILYIGVKISYDWQLRDTETISALLSDIFSCEGTFERIIIGAIFGTRAPYYIAGWKSDFLDQEENVRAMVFYLDHATSAALEYEYENRTTRYIDIPIESCGKSTALKVVIQLGLPDKLHILLRYGAVVDDGYNEETILEWLVKKLYEYKGCYPYNFVSCLQLLLRSLPNIYINDPVDFKKQRDVLFENYPEIIEHGIIPINRCGVTPAELKHLCRCTIRQLLWRNYKLPNGIRKLPVPEALHRYLDLLED